MSDGDGFDGDDFDDALHALLRDAERSDVDLLGAWQVERDGDGAWEVLISEVVPEAGDDD